MVVNIHISGDNAAEALRELAGLAGPLVGNQAAKAVAEVAATSATVEVPTQKRTRSKPAEDKPAEVEPEKSEPAGDPDPGADVETSDEPVPTVVELRAKASPIGTTTEGKARIKALLAEFESPSISNVPENKRASFAKRLDEIAEELKG